MKTSTWSKVMSWVQFGLMSFAQITQNGGLPHNWTGWLTLGGSAAIAVAAHAASNTGGPSTGN